MDDYFNTTCVSGDDFPGNPDQGNARVNTFSSVIDEVQWKVETNRGTLKDISPENKTGERLSFGLEVEYPLYEQLPRFSGGSPARSQPHLYVLDAHLPELELYDTVILEQDEIDIIRQEYENHRQVGMTLDLPAREDFRVVPEDPNSHFTAAEINRTAYDYILGNPRQLAEEVRAAYNAQIDNRLTQKAITEFLENPDPEAPFPELVIGSDFGLNISNSWRNPERNERVDGVLNSNHQLGDAIDFVVLEATEISTGLTRNELFCLLRDGANDVGRGLLERDSTQVFNCNPGTIITHVHADRRRR